MRWPLLTSLSFLIAGCGAQATSLQPQAQPYFALTNTTSVIDGTAQPANGATNVALNAVVSVQFSNPINSSSITRYTFQVISVNTNTLVQGVISVSSDGRTLYFTPTVTQQAGGFLANTEYAVTGMGWKDYEGLTIANYSWRFTTIGNSKPTGAFKITSVTPNSGAICSSTAWRIEFSQQIAPPPVLITNSVYPIPQGFGAAACQTEEWSQAIHLVDVADTSGGLIDVPSVICMSCETGTCNVLYVLPLQNTGVNIAGVLQLSINQSPVLTGVSGEVVSNPQSVSKAAVQCL